MLRISLVENGGGAVCLRLEGRAVGAWVAEIQAQCEAKLRSGSSLCLDLSDVTYIDREGSALMSNLRSRGVTLVGCSPFLKEELKMGMNNSDAA